MTDRSSCDRGGRTDRPGRSASRSPGNCLLLLPLAVLCAACTGPHAEADAAPHSGSYPVATPQPQVAATPHVTADGYQLVAAGNPVDVSLPGAELVAQVSGPDVDLPTPAPGQPITAASAPGVLTVSLTATSGTLAVSASQFLGLDENQDPIGLRPDTDQVTVDPGHPATLHLSAQFVAGHTTLTWQPLGHPFITWDFTVEID